MDIKLELHNLIKNNYDKILIVDAGRGRYEEYSVKDLQILEDGSYDEYTLEIVHTVAESEKIKLIKQMELSRILYTLNSTASVVKIRYTAENTEIPNHYEFLVYYLNRDKNQLVFLRQSIPDRTAYEAQNVTAVESDSKALRFISDQLLEYFIEYNVTTDVYRRIYVRPDMGQNIPVKEFMQKLFESVTPEHQDNFKQEYDLNHLLPGLRKGSGKHSSVFPILTNLGKKYYSITNVLVCSDDDPNQEYIYSYAQDITKLKEEENRNIQLASLSRQLLSVSQSDGLTGLTNRTTGETMIKEYLDHYEGKHSGTLFLIDIDYFKNINDTYGHAAGDATLQFFSAALKKVFRSSDIICRWGGDEFLVFMHNIYKQENIQSRLVRLQSIIKTFSFHENPIPFTLSAGVVPAAEKESLVSLFNEADSLLYKAKNAGRNAYMIRE